MLRNIDQLGRGKSFFTLSFARLLAAWAMGLFLLTGCFSFHKFPPIDLSQPGWRVQQGEALWTPQRGMPELAGELVLADHTDGRSFVQFTKGNLPIVTGQFSATHWRIEFPPRKLSFAARGAPPARFGWLQLPRALRGEKLPNVWSMVKKEGGGWRLENRKTGEALEGILSP